MFLTLIETRFLSFCDAYKWDSNFVLPTSGDNFRDEKGRKYWSEQFLLNIYIVVCYFFFDHILYCIAVHAINHHYHLILLLCLPWKILEQLFLQDHLS